MSFKGWWIETEEWMCLVVMKDDEIDTRLSEFMCLNVLGELCKTGDDEWGRIIYDEMISNQYGRVSFVGVGV